jgi:hypothetical protein
MTTDEPRLEKTGLIATISFPYEALEKERARTENNNNKKRRERRGVDRGPSSRVVVPRCNTIAKDCRCVVDSFKAIISSVISYIGIGTVATA